MGNLASCVRPKNTDGVGNGPAEQHVAGNYVGREKSSESISIGEEYRRLQSKKQKIKKHRQVWLFYDRNIPKI